MKDEKKNRYELSFSDLLATQMKERVKCTILIDGVEHGYYDNSIENYCYKTINNPDESDAMKYLAKRISLYGDACAITYGN